MIARRDLLHSSLSAAILGLFSTGQSGRAAAATLANSFSPRTEPYRMVRELIRELGNGQQVRVTREWALRFLRDGDGYRLAGEQIQVDVAAPPGLEMLAKLEQARVEHGPIRNRLNAAGMIIGGSGQTANESFSAALQIVADMLPGQQASDRSALSQLQMRLDNAISPLPVDLFAPMLSEWSEEREMPLANGTSGQIAISYNATRDARSGVMTTTRRELTSTVGDSSRKTVESWSLA